MLEQICAFIHNYFKTVKHEGTFTISSGVLAVDFLVNGQYFLISGSKLNDGVYQYPAQAAQGKPPILADETFTGEIWEMAPPRMFLDLVKEIEAWNDKYGDASISPYASESFGGYSYTMAQGYASAGGGMLNSWQSIFSSRLNQWRKLA